MALARNTKTGLISELPLNIINHRKLGKNLELYFEDEEEVDKVVIAKRVYKKSEAGAEDTTSKDLTVTDFDEVGE